MKYDGCFAGNIPEGTGTLTDAAGNTVAELPILAGEDVGHVTFVQMLGRCLARGFCMGPQS